MKADNPLWYDEVAPEDEPGVALLALARMTDGLRSVFAMLRRLCRLPDRPWG